MTIKHTSTAFEEDLTSIRAGVIEMAADAHNLLSQAVDALLRADDELAASVIKADVALDRKQRALETRSVQLIARRQPMADDLREIIGAMRIVSNLERIGDLAKSIAKRVTILDGPLARRIVSTGFASLSSAALDQLASVNAAYSDNDLQRARAVREDDERIDDLYNALFRELLTYMLEDQRAITVSANLLFCAKNLERVGDHATNLAETIEFIITGDEPADDRPRSKSATGLRDEDDEHSPH